MATRPVAAQGFPPPHRPVNDLQRLLAESAQARAEAKQSRIASKRLRLDCVKTRLDLAERLVTIGDPEVHGEPLVTLFRGRALAMYRNTRDAMSNPGWTDMERQALEPRLNRLRLLMTDLGILQEGVQSPSSVPVAEEPAPVLQNNSHADGLSKRETEVLKLVAEGNSTKQVAFILGIRFKTAACHRYRVMEKLGIHDTATLVLYAVRRGLVQP